MFMQRGLLGTEIFFKGQGFLPTFFGFAHSLHTAQSYFVLQNAIAFSQVSSSSGNRTSERARGLFGPSDRSGKVTLKCGLESLQVGCNKHYEPIFKV